jgi:hypothetical protein
VNCTGYYKYFHVCCSVVVIMKNRSPNKDHTVSVTLRVDTVLYTGRVKDAVKKYKVERLVKVGAGRCPSLEFQYYHCVL